MPVDLFIIFIFFSAVVLLPGLVLAAHGYFSRKEYSAALETMKLEGAGDEEMAPIQEEIHASTKRLNNGVYLIVAGTLIGSIPFILSS